MPSPVAHSLAGVAIVGVARYLRASRRVQQPRVIGVPMLLVLMMAAANAPDLDFVPGVLVGYPDWLHRGISHSLGAALLFGGLSGAIAAVGRLQTPGLIGVLMALAYASHLLLDMFSPDPMRFNGVPLFWPLSEQHFVLPAQVFLDIRRAPGAEGFVASLWHWHNLEAMVREVLIMVPLLLAGGLLTRGWSGLGAAPRVRPRLDRRLDSES